MFCKWSFWLRLETSGAIKCSFTSINNFSLFFSSCVFIKVWIWLALGMASILLRHSFILSFISMILESEEHLRMYKSSVTFFIKSSTLSFTLNSKNFIMDLNPSSDSFDLSTFSEIAFWTFKILVLLLLLNTRSYANFKFDCSFWLF